MSNVKKFRIIKFKSKPILLAKSVSKSFDGRVILRKIDIHLNQAEMLGLLGSNGAGKSTFMNIVLGLLKCDFGDIFLGNIKLTNLAIHERSKLGISYLPQQTAIFRGLTVYENLLGIAQIVKKGSKEQEEIVEKLMVEFSITHLRDVKATALSGGERRRTEIARALAVDPKFILLDEPFAGVDPIAVEDIQSIISILKKKNIGILITDHNVQETLAITDKTYLMFEGKILLEGVPEKLAEDEMVRKVYLGKNFEFKRKKL